ncbi:MAG: ABC transporter ATP-binding protein [Cyclobacteriaceae bacterium]
MENNALLKIKDLHVGFKMRQGLVKAVNGVSFDLNAGKILALVGESGSGKSVAAKSILRIESPGKITNGQIEYNSAAHGPINIHDLKPRGKTIRSIRWKEISMIFQEPMTSFGPMHTFGNQITEAVILHENLSKEDARDRAIESLEQVGMPRPDQLLKQYPHQISGGMRQRAMIAMAMICNPKILIADEPTTALDVSTEAQILKVLRERQRNLQTSVLYISHNLGVVYNIADEVAVMYLGEVVEQAPVIELFESPKHPYTEALLNAIPRLDRSDHKSTEIKGSIPDPYNHPKGCKFHPRCPKFIEGHCDVYKPAIQELEQNRKVSCHLYSQKNHSEA